MNASAAQFTGPNAMRENGNKPVPLAIDSKSGKLDAAHIGVELESLMNPAAEWYRQDLGPVESAMLQDFGWQISEPRKLTRVDLLTGRDPRFLSTIIRPGTNGVTALRVDALGGDRLVFETVDGDTPDLIGASTALELYDTDGTFIAADDNYDLFEKSEIHATLEHGGTYYVAARIKKQSNYSLKENRPSKWDGSSPSFILRAALVRDPDAEPNNINSAGNAIVFSDRSYEHTTTLFDDPDVDVYPIDALAGHSYTIVTRLPVGGGLAKLALAGVYDQSGRLFAGMGPSENYDVFGTMNFAPAASGRYYVRISHLVPSAEVSPDEGTIEIDHTGGSDYTLTVTDTTDARRFSRVDLFTGRAPGSRSRLVDPVADGIALFRVDALGGDLLIVGTENGSTTAAIGADTALELYDTDGNLIAADETPSKEKSEIHATLPFGGTYYIAARLAQQADYSFSKNRPSTWNLSSPLYTLNATLRRSPDAEPNNIGSAIHPIIFNNRSCEYTTTMFDDKDVDVFPLDAIAGHSYTIVTRLPARGGLAKVAYAGVYDRNGTRLAGMEASENFETYGTITFTPAASGRCFIRISRVVPISEVNPAEVIPPTDRTGGSDYTLSVVDTAAVTPPSGPGQTGPPTLADIANVSIDEGKPLAADADANDPDAGQTLTYALAPGFPDGMTIDPATGKITWTPTEAQGPGNFPVTVNVADNGDPRGTDSASFTITVNEVNQNPALGAIANRELAAGESLAVTAAATDADLPANTLIFALGAGAPQGVAIDGKTGALTWPVPASQSPGDYPITVNVSDGKGGTDAKTFTVTIKSPQPPPPPALVVPVSVRVIKKRALVSAVELVFSNSLNATSAGTIRNFRLAGPGKSSVIKLKSASFNAATNSVRINLRNPLCVTKRYQLRANGLLDATGRSIDGNRDNAAGGELLVVITEKNATLG